MGENDAPKASRAKTLREWVALATGLTGAILGLLGFMEVRGEQRLHRILQAGEHIDKATALLESGFGLMSFDGSKELAAGAEDSAEREIRVALELDPDDPYVHMRKVDLLELSGRSKEALEYCKKAVTRFPNYSQLYIKLGHLYQVNDRTADAVVSYKSALAKSNGNTQVQALAHNNLGVLYYGAAIANGRSLKAAYDEYSEAVRKSPENRIANYNLGILLCREGKIEDARPHLAKVPELSPPGCLAAAASSENSSPNTVQVAHQGVPQSPDSRMRTVGANRSHKQAATQPMHQAMATQSVPNARNAQEDREAVRLEGTVLSSVGLPVSDVHVTAYSAGKKVAESFTSAEGVYRLSIPAGTPIESLQFIRDGWRARALPGPTPRDQGHFRVVLLRPGEEEGAADTAKVGSPKSGFWSFGDAFFGNSFDLPRAASPTRANQ